jgi:hypothetical protein
MLVSGIATNHSTAYNDASRTGVVTTRRLDSPRRTLLEARHTMATRKSTKKPVGGSTANCRTCGRLFNFFPSESYRKSCSRECAVAWRKAHPIGHGQSKTRLYTIWCHIKSRCHNPTCDTYPWYGAKGIAMCDEWRGDFVAFREWAMANGYADDLEIDRIDVGGNYEPGNCRWATRRQQMMNTGKRVHTRSSKTTSRYKGVGWHAITKKWRALIAINGHTKHLGLFASERDAAMAYDAAAKELFGEYANTNF